MYQFISTATLRINVAAVLRDLVTKTSYGLCGQKLCRKAEDIFFRHITKLKFLDFFASAEAKLAKISAKTPLAAALLYALRRKDALLRYTGDGRLEIDNNRAENAIRGVAIGRKNWLFAGADCGGERAAAIYKLIETAKLSNVNPQDWLSDVLDRIGKGQPINRLDELLPRAWGKITD